MQFMQLYLRLWEYFAVKVMHTQDLFSCVSLGKYVKGLLMHTQQTYVH